MLRKKTNQQPRILAGQQETETSSCQLRAFFLHKVKSMRSRIVPLILMRMIKMEMR